MRSPRVAMAAALLALTGGLAACGDDDGGSESAEDERTETVTVSPTEPTTDATTTDATPTDATPMDPTEGDITLEQVDAALLTPEEVAPGLVEGQWTDEDGPPPCDQSAEPVDEAVPPAVESGVEINTPDGAASMTEEIAVYDTEDLANQAFTLGSAGLDCSTVTLSDGTTATIGAPQDVTAEVNTSGIGTSTAWQVTGEGYEVVLVATLAGRLVMATTFTVTEGADTSDLPSPIDIAAAAFAKALAN